jgi:hypothetical protein
MNDPVGGLPYTHSAAGLFDKGVRGFDLEDRGGGSEPTLQKRR